MQKNENMRNAVCKNISDTIGKTFVYASHRVSEKNPKQYTVTGTIMRHGSVVNVEAAVDIEGLGVTYWCLSDDAITMLPLSAGDIELDKHIVISDPSYNRSVWCMTQKDNARPGIWRVEASIDTIDTWGERLYIIALYHVSVYHQQDSLQWREAGKVGVDSAAMSVMDDRYYRHKDGSADAFEADEQLRGQFAEFYYGMHDQYVGFYQAEGKNVGVICSAGIGDGHYPYDLAEENGEIVAIRVRFL